MSDTQSIVAAASQLPEQDRLRVVEALLDTLEPPADDEPGRIADAWRDEVRRRSEELRTGAVKPLLWSEVRAEGERLLDGRD